MLSIVIRFLPAIYLFFIIFGFFVVGKKIDFVILKFLKISNENNKHQKINLKFFFEKSFYALIFFSVLFIILGFIGALYKNLLISLYFIIFFFIISEYKTIIYLLSNLLNIFRQFDRITKIFCIYIIFNILLHLPGAISPVVSSDAMVYHLPLAKFFLTAKKVMIVNFLFYSFYPQLTELFLAFGLSLGAPEFSQVLHLYFFILIIVCIYLICRRLNLSAIFSFAAVIIFITAPAVNRLAGYTKNEFFLIFFNITSIYFFIEFLFDYNSKKNIILLAISAALSNNIKYSGLIHSSILCALVFITIIFRYFFLEKSAVEEKASHKKNDYGFKIYFLTVLCLIIISMPFYLRNYFITNNPFFPFAQSIFKTNLEKIATTTSKSLNIETKQMTRHFSKPELRGDKKIFLKNLILFPYNIIIDFQMFDFWKYALPPISFLLFCAIIIALFLKNTIKKNMLFLLFLYILAFMYTMFFLAPRCRYLLPVLPIISIAGVYSVSELKKNSGIKYLSLNFFLVFGLITFLFTALINLPLLAAQHINRYKYLFGKESKFEYLSNRFYPDGEFYKTLDWVNKNLPATSKIFSTQPYIFYFNFDVLTGYSPNLPLSPINKGNVSNADDLYQQLINNGITHIFYSEKAARRYNYEDMNLLMEDLIKKKKIIEIKRFYNNIVYKIEINAN